MTQSITKEQLLSLCPTADGPIISNIWKYQALITDYGIINHRLPMFMAQIAHESDGFRTTEEYASGKAYEGRADLGNVDIGDGVKFKGRGLIQLTGRANYEYFSRILGKPLSAYPETVSGFPLALEVSCLFWKIKDLNKLADEGNFEKITKRINGGLNGYEQRLDYLERAIDIFV